MIPYFNTSGPCVAGQHYMLPPERRLGRVMELIEQGRYFTLHAGRQTGKTTCARWLVDQYNAGERYCAIWVDIQTAREEPDPEKAFRTIFTKLDQWVQIDLPAVGLPSEREVWLRDASTAILRYLAHLASRAPRPLLVFFDEADGLVGQSMVIFLAQLRDGYVGRSKSPFPHSIALIGMRQVRDYVLRAEDRRTLSWLGTTSPFNITAEAQTLAPFTQDEVAELFGQHTLANGQRFEDEAVERTFYLSQGHPWLINALADEAVRVEAPDRSQSVTAAPIDAAKETIILERRTHIDSLMARLREPRVRRVIEPMLTGSAPELDRLDDDLSYVQGLGLIALAEGGWRIANAVYREVIPRALTSAAQTSLAQQTLWYVRPDGSLDLEKLFRAFQDFWRKDGHLAAQGFFYREAGPQLMLMAFLQRVVNAGGRIEREYGFGRGRADLMVVWRPGAGTSKAAAPVGEQRFVVEVKLKRGALASVVKTGIEQTLDYMGSCGTSEGALVIFDRTKGKPWSKKIFRKVKKVGRKRVTVWGM